MSDINILSHFLTDFGDLTYSFINRHTPDIAIAIESFLNEEMPSNFGRLPGYTDWARRDRIGRQGFKKSMQIQQTDVDMTDHFEIMFFKV